MLLQSYLNSLLRKDGWSALWKRSSAIPPSQPTASCSKRRQIMFGQLKKNRESTQSCFHYGSVFCFCVHGCLLNDTDIADSRDEEREEKLRNVNKAAISTVKDTKSFSIFILTPKELLHCTGWTKLNAGCFNENFHLSDECADAKCQPEKDDLIGNGTLGVRISTSITVQQYLKYPLMVQNLFVSLEKFTKCKKYCTQVYMFLGSPYQFPLVAFSQSLNSNI